MGFVPRHVVIPAAVLGASLHSALAAERFDKLTILPPRFSLGAHVPNQTTVNKPLSTAS
jgi:hypothetical protein